MHGSPKTAILLTTFLHVVGRAKTSGPSRPDASPSAESDPARPNRRRTVQVENMRRFKLGPNVASLAAN